MDARTQSQREHTQRAMDEAKAAAGEAGEQIKSAAGEMAEAGRESRAAMHFS